jgi:hypothetical protein
MLTAISIEALKIFEDFWNCYSCTLRYHVDIDKLRNDFQHRFTALRVHPGHELPLAVSTDK